MLEHKEKMCPMMPTQTFNKPFFCPLTSVKCLLIHTSDNQFLFSEKSQFWHLINGNFIYPFLNGIMIFSNIRRHFGPKIGKSASQTSADGRENRNRKNYKNSCTENWLIKSA
jgi:hypothetical protein